MQWVIQLKARLSSGLVSVPDIRIRSDFLYGVCTSPWLHGVPRVSRFPLTSKDLGLSSQDQNKPPQESYSEHPLLTGQHIHARDVKHNATEKGGEQKLTSARIETSSHCKLSISTSLSDNSWMLHKQVNSFGWIGWGARGYVCLLEVTWVPYKEYSYSSQGTDNYMEICRVIETGNISGLK